MLSFFFIAYKLKHFSTVLKWKCKLLTYVWIFATPQIATHQPPLPMKFPRQEYRSVKKKERKKERKLGRVAISFSQGFSWPRHWTQVSCISGRFFSTWTIREAMRGEGEVFYYMTIFYIFKLIFPLLLSSWKQNI